MPGDHGRDRGIPRAEPESRMSAPGLRPAPPSAFVIFGAAGDLTKRKLLPALYNLKAPGLLPRQFAILGVARKEKSHEQFREDMKKDINSYSRIKPVDEGFWKTFKEQIFYHCSEFDQNQGYESLGEFLKTLDAQFGTKGNRVFKNSPNDS